VFGQFGANELPLLQRHEGLVATAAAGHFKFSVPGWQLTERAVVDALDVAGRANVDARVAADARLRRFAKGRADDAVGPAVGEAHGRRAEDLLTDPNAQPAQDAASTFGAGFKSRCFHAELLSQFQQFYGVRRLGPEQFQRRSPGFDYIRRIGSDG